MWSALPNPVEQNAKRGRRCLSLMLNFRPQHMHALMLHGNVFDRLATDDSTRHRLSHACSAGIVRALVSPVVQQELEASHFGGIPDFFPVVIVTESVVETGRHVR